MNFDKFRQIDMPDVDAQADPTYIKKLDGLPTKRKSPMPVILTVSAAVFMLAVFGLWAIIGSAVREGRISEYIAEGADPESVQTHDVKEIYYPHQFDVAYYDMLPLFDEDNPPSFVELMSLNFFGDDDGIFTQEELSQTAAMFGVTATLPDDKPHYAPSNAIYHEKYNVEIPIFLSIKSYDMQDGSGKNFIVTYEFKQKKYVLSYIAQDVGKKPDRYISNTPLGEKLEKEYYDDKIYSAVRQEVFSDDNIKSASFYIYDYGKISDELYVCSLEVIGFEGITYKDESTAKPILAQKELHFGAIRALFIENKDGKLAISDNQDRDVPLQTYAGNRVDPNKSNFTEFYRELIKSLGVIPLAEFDQDDKISVKDTVPCEDDEFSISYVINYSPQYGQSVTEIGYVKDGREYAIGYLFEKYILFKKENKLYTDVGVTVAEDSTPFMYDAKNELPAESFLPQSMGIEIPNINDKLVLPRDAVPIADNEEYKDMVEELTGPDHYHDGVPYYNMTLEELRKLGYTQYNYIAQTEYYNVIVDASARTRLFHRFPTFTEVIRSVHDGWKQYLFEMRLLKELGYRYYLDTFSEEQLLTLKEYGITQYDISYLLEKYGSPEKVLKQSKKQLKATLTEYYTEKYNAVMK